MNQFVVNGDKLIKDVVDAPTSTPAYANAMYLQVPKLEPFVLQSLEVLQRPLVEPLRKKKGVRSHDFC